MIQINLFDLDFAHGTSSVHGKTPKTFEYVRNQYVWNGITIFTNDLIFSSIVDQVKSKIKIAWLLEPKSIKPMMYEYISYYENKFDYIITHDSHLLSKNQKYIFAPVGGCWIDENTMPLEKKKLVSIISSSKNFTEGHRLRHEIIKKIKNKVDIYGNGYNPIKTKEEGLLDYKFSIVIENSSVENYFTEKLIDCFATKTIPIYWGCTNLSLFFDKNSYISFKDADEIVSVINSIDSIDIPLDLIEKNFSLSKNYSITEDWIFENFIKKLV